MKKHKPIPPMGVSINEPMWKRVARAVAYVAVATVIGLLMFLFLLEWAAGCGESFVDSKGVTHLNECLFVNVNRGESI